MVVGVDVVEEVLGASQVDDRDVRELPAVRDLTGAVRDLLRDHVGLRTRRGEVEVDVGSADARVQSDELRRRYRPRVQRVQAVLDPDVGDRRAGEAVLRAEAPDRRLVVLNVAANARRVRRRVVDHRRERRSLQVAVLDARRDADRREREIPRRADARVADVHHRGLLRRREARITGEVVAKQVAVADLVRGRPAVLEAAVRLDAVEQPRVVRGDLMLLDRAARAAGADRVADRAVRLDDVLLQHHQRLRRHDVVRIVAADVEVVVRDEEAA